MGAVVSGFKDADQAAHSASKGCENPLSSLASERETVSRPVGNERASNRRKGDRMFQTRCLVFGYAFTLSFWAGVGAVAAPLGTAFTYQGQLKQGGAPMDGTANMVFKLFDAAAAGNLLGTQTVNDVPVTNGLFTVELNAGRQFGANAFNGEQRWLEISVNATPLAPRQELTTTPYAQFAAKPWATSGTNISYAMGNVGIGTDSPTSMLHFQRPYSDTGIRFQSLRFDQGAPGAALRAPGSAATSGVGEPWNTPAAALTSNDAYATSNLSEVVGKPDADQSRFLDLTAAGFALPAGAQITGFTVQTEGHVAAVCSGCETAQVTVFAELLGGLAPSQTRSFRPTSSDTNHVTGGTFDSWGLEWTPNAVNADAFGVRLSANLVLGETICIFGGCGIVPCDCAGTGTAFVDAVTITVHFFNAPTTSTPVDWSLGLSQDDANFRIAATPDLSSPNILINPQGNVGIGTTAPDSFFKLALNGFAAKTSGPQWSTLSDARLKRNVEPLKGALERMLLLRGVTFEFTEEGLRTGLALPGRHTGLIAQEVEPVFPDWVDETPSGYKFVTEHGTTALLVEALRELRAEKDAQIAELMKRLSQVEAQIQIGREQKGN